MEQITVPQSGPVQARLRPPSSKSITNRALICAALANGVSRLRLPLTSDDTFVMIDSLRRLGIEVEESAAELKVHGLGGVTKIDKAELQIGNSGTSVRFLTAMTAALQGEFTLDGVARMRERPIQDLADALNQLGGNVSSIKGTGCPPVLVQAQSLSGGDVSIRGDISSQFLSGLLMATPYAKATTIISVDGELISQPYVEMTLAVMKEFGVDVATSGDSKQQEASDVTSTALEFTVQPQIYSPIDYEIEPDASAASYFWAAAAITGGTATVLGLNRNSLQGDVGFCDLLVRMGCQLRESDEGMTISGAKRLTGIDCDMGDVSDTAQTLAAVALFAEGETTIRGIAHNRHKETDRIGNLAIELRKFGAKVDELDDGLRIKPPAVLQSAVIDTYDDHRMAMSLALPGLKVSGVAINDPGCTAKTYPNYFEDLTKICV